MALKQKTHPSFKNSVSMVSPQQLLLTFVPAESADHSSVPTSPVYTSSSTDSIKSTEERKRRTRVVWGASETRILLDVWGPKYEEIKSGSIAIKRDMWRNIALEFDRKCAENNLRGVSMSLDQLRKRTANLEYKYQQVKAKIAISDQNQALRLKAGFPFFESLDYILGKGEVNRRDYKNHIETASIDSPSANMLQNDLGSEELDFSSSLTHNSTDSLTTHDQRSTHETAEFIVNGNSLGKEGKGKRNQRCDDEEEPCFKRLCKFWEESIGRQEQWFNRIIEMQERILTNQTHQTTLLVEGLKDIVTELINTS